MIELPPGSDDAASFLRQVEAILRALAARYSPEHLIAVHIRDWFGSNWLPFTAGDRRSAGEYHRELPIPAFVPNRVLGQDRFGAPDYHRVDSGPALARNTTSANVHTLHARDVVPDTVLAWYSGGSARSGRASLLVFVPLPDAWWAWYAGWSGEPDWHPTTLSCVSREELHELIGSEDEGP